MSKNRGDYATTVAKSKNMVIKSNCYGILDEKEVPLQTENLNHLTNDFNHGK